MSDEKMLAAKADGVGRMTFNNPERRNAVSLEMWERAEEILKDFAADDAVLRRAGVRLGEDYPEPAVGLAEGRQRALDALQAMKHKRDG